MVRLIILDIGGMYAKIYDEIRCNITEVPSRTKEYSDPNFLIVKIEY